MVRRLQHQGRQVARQMRRGIWYNVIIIKHILVNYQSRNGKESRMKKMLMAFALCASMMLPGQDNPPEGIRSN